MSRYHRCRCSLGPVAAQPVTQSESICSAKGEERLRYSHPQPDKEAKLTTDPDITSTTTTTT